MGQAVRAETSTGSSLQLPTQIIKNNDDTRRMTPLTPNHPRTRRPRCPTPTDASDRCDRTGAREADTKPSDLSHSRYTTALGNFVFVLDPFTPSSVFLPCILILVSLVPPPWAHLIVGVQHVLLLCIGQSKAIGIPRRSAEPWHGRRSRISSAHWPQAENETFLSRL